MASNASSGKESRAGGEFTEKVVKVRRCATVVKGGRRFSFAGLVVVGNGKGKVGCGYGKANEVPPAVEKAIKDGSPMQRMHRSWRSVRSTSSDGNQRAMPIPWTARAI